MGFRKVIEGQTPEMENEVTKKVISSLFGPKWNDKFHSERWNVKPGIIELAPLYGEQPQFHGLYETPSPSGECIDLLVSLDLRTRNSFTIC